MIDPIDYYRAQGLGDTPFLRQSITPTEWQYLHNAALECQGDILEIGVYFYASSTAFLSAMEINGWDNHLWSVDIEHRKYQYHPTNEDAARRWFRISSSSRAFLPELNVIQIGFELIYIDGDHSRKGVQQDFKECKHLLQYGGRILIHDTNSENLRKALFEIEPEANFRDVFRDKTSHRFGMMEWRPK